MHPIERSWYQRSPLTGLLLPLAILFWLLAGLRRGLYRLGILKSNHLPVPVIVVGNITVGGAGKTPLTLYLAQALKAAGYQPGIISRGYGGSATEPLEVMQSTPASLCGDEPLLLKQRSGLPVAVHRHRAQAGQLLLARHPEINCLICDDGLQHLSLQRDIELVVVDTLRGLGNRLPLPAGPLREPAARLRQCDALVLNGTHPCELPAHPHTFNMRLTPGHIYKLGAPETTRDVQDLHQLRCAAVAGIANPQRFLNTLNDLGVQATLHAFADHHAFTATDLSNISADMIVVTEKDATKLKALNDGRIWVLPVDAQLTPDLANWITLRLTELHSRPDQAS